MSDEPDESEKTEDPSQRKLDEAIRRGDVAKSQEVSTWFVLAGSTLVLFAFAGGMAGDLTQTLKMVLAQSWEISTDAGGLISLARQLGLAVALAMLAPIAILIVAGIAGHMIQHPPILSVEPVTPKLSKISPISGFKRLFSSQSLMNFVKGLIKIVIVSTVMFVIVWPERDRLDALIRTDLGDLLGVIALMALKLMVGSVAVLALVAGLDFLYQRHVWHKKQRMTIKEVRDEYKQMEGDPTVKAKLRQIRAERGRRRMMAKVPQASVVITNPTHFAVALRYEKGMSAPVCLAKGTDRIALRIRELAAEHSIPIVENPPLARALHASVEIDREIDPDHYKAVAEVIGYVMKIGKGRWQTDPAR
ncbi:MAG: flagellar biosynthesis protein FlhB [Flavobacteriaceae bacterium]